MSVHGEPLLQLGDLCDGVNKSTISLPSLITTIKRIGQVQSPSAQRWMTLPVMSSWMMTSLHLWNVVAHIHYGVSGEHGVWANHRKWQLAARIWRWSSVFFHLRHILIVNVQVF